MPCFQQTRAVLRPKRLVPVHVCEFDANVDYSRRALLLRSLLVCNLHTYPRCGAANLISRWPLDKSLPNAHTLATTKVGEITLDTDGVRRFVKEQIAYLKDNEVLASDIGDTQALSSDPDEPTLESLELDSLDQVELALAIETEFNIGTPEDLDFRSFQSVNDIVEFVVSLLDTKPVG